MQAMGGKQGMADGGLPGAVFVTPTSAIGFTTTLALSLSSPVLINGVVLVADREGRQLFSSVTRDTASLPPRNNREIVEKISELKSEPQWMLDLRLKGLRLFDKKPMPTWGSDLSGIHFDTIKYFVRATDQKHDSWESLPDDIKALAENVLAHRLLVTPEAQLQGITAADALDEVLRTVPVPAAT